MSNKKIADYKIFQTVRDEKPRFKNHDGIQKILKSICESWAEYLVHHISLSSDLFCKEEYPWTKNERVLVSSLAASIFRLNRNSLIVEELPVKKYSSASDNGRSDLWAHIPVKGKDSFNFYLEAKKFRTSRDIEQIEGTLIGKNGIKRMFIDYAKSRKDGTVSQNSSYKKLLGRNHPHFHIGLICLPLKGEIDIPDVGKIFEKCFSGVHDVSEAGQRRKVTRFPTTAFCITTGFGNPSFFASFTVVAGDSSI